MEGSGPEIATPARASAGWGGVGWEADTWRLPYAPASDFDLVVQPDLVARQPANAPGMAGRLEDGDLDVLRRDAG